MISVKMVSGNEVRKGLDYTANFELYKDGLLTGPSSARIMIWSYNGELIVNSAACTIDPYTSLISYVVPKGIIDTLEQDYQIQLKCTVSGEDTYSDFLFDVVLHPLTCTVTDTDLQAEHPDIMSDIWTGQITYTNQIKDAFEDVKRELKQKGSRPAMLLDASQIQHLIVAKTFEKIFFDFAKDTNDIWWQRYLKESDRYQKLFDGLRVRMDNDEDNVIDAEKTFSTVELVR